MPIAKVSECLQRARECADMAEKLDGDQKKRLMDAAQAWLKLAEEAALQAERNRSVKEPPGSSLSH